MAPPDPALSPYRGGNVSGSNSDEAGIPNDFFNLVDGMVQRHKDFATREIKQLRGQTEEAHAQQLAQRIAFEQRLVDLRLEMETTLRQFESRTQDRAQEAVERYARLAEDAFELLQKERVAMAEDALALQDAVRTERERTQHEILDLNNNLRLATDALTRERLRTDELSGQVSSLTVALRTAEVAMHEQEVQFRHDLQAGLRAAVSETSSAAKAEAAAVALERASMIEAARMEADRLVANAHNAAREERNTMQNQIAQIRAECSAAVDRIRGESARTIKDLSEELLKERAENAAAIAALENAANSKAESIEKVVLSRADGLVDSYRRMAQNLESQVNVVREQLEAAESRIRDLEHQLEYSKAATLQARQECRISADAAAEEARAKCTAAFMGKIDVMNMEREAIQRSLEDLRLRTIGGRR